jgi:segregation and condensation protein A
MSPSGLAAWGIDPPDLEPPEPELFDPDPEPFGLEPLDPEPELPDPGPAPPELEGGQVDMPGVGPFVCVSM